jgi:type IV pilus assembly protein PilM
MAFSSFVLSIFPTPAYLLMPGAGLDISDHSVKFVEFSHARAHERRLSRYGSMDIPQGVVEGGTVRDKKKLIEILSAFREQNRLRFVRASLPEEKGYIFAAYVPEHITDRETRDVLEFKLAENVPLSPDDATVDFDPVPGAPILSNQHMVSVSAYPTVVAQEYADLLRAAGFEPLSLEIEAQAIARAVVPKKSTGVAMLVDVGRTRSGIAVVRGQAVRLTATVTIGGDSVDAVLSQMLSLSSGEELVRLKNEQGLQYAGDAGVREAFTAFAKQLATEIDRYIVYWQTHRDLKGTATPHPLIERIILSGGNANMHGLPEYLSNELRIPVSRGNVWENAFSLESYVPNISFSDSLGYASAAGLALHEDA